MERSEIRYEYNPDGVNEVIDEISATSYLALREVKWSEDDNYKLDLRRYFIKQDETEMPGKGTSIGNPNRLTEALIDHKFGNTQKVLEYLSTRDDYMSSMGAMCANYSNEEYDTFKTNLDTERANAIENRGLDSEEFMENLK